MQHSERELYALGPRLLSAGAPMPDLPAEDLAHVLRGMWDRAGFVGPNNGGYPVASLLAPLPLADDIADVIRAVTGKRSPARPLHRMYWVGVSGHACAAWLRYLYGSATVSSPHKLEQARALMNLGAGSVPYSAGREG